MTKQIEIEFKALLSEAEYDRIFTFLKENAEDLGADDKEFYYFIFRNKLLKVVNNIAKQTAKISLKMNRLGQGSDFEEIEIPIDPADVEKTKYLFTKLGFEHYGHAHAIRHNFLYHGVEFAIKISKDLWKHHLEMEIVINDLANKLAAETKIKQLADELGIKLMSDQELQEFEKKILEEKGHSLN